MRLNFDRFKVEGGPRMKALVYGGALVMVLAIVGVMYLLLGRIGSGPPEVGTVTLISGGVEVQPLQNQIYLTQNGEKREQKRLVPGEIGNDAPTVEYDSSITLMFDGKSDNGPFYFTIYDEEERIYSEIRAEFVAPDREGRYLVCEETYWGQKDENIGMEYYFWIEVGSEDLA